MPGARTTNGRTATARLQSPVGLYATARKPTTIRDQPGPCKPEAGDSVGFVIALEHSPAVRHQCDEDDGAHGAGDAPIDRRRTQGHDTTAGHDHPQAVVDRVTRSGRRVGQYRQRERQQARQGDVRRDGRRRRRAVRPPWPSTLPRSRSSNAPDARARLADERQPTCAEQQCRRNRRQPGGDLGHAAGTQPAFARSHDRLTPAGDLQLGEDRGQVIAHGLRREVQLGCDVGVAQALGQVIEDEALAVGELGERVVDAGIARRARRSSRAPSTPPRGRRSPRRPPRCAPPARCRPARPP